MAKDYKLEIVEGPKQKAPKIRVSHNIDEHWVNTFADLAEEQDLNLMSAWCEENKCGHRTAYNEFKFRNKDQMVLFILRWS